MDWLLYDRDLHHERINFRQAPKCLGLSQSKMKRRIQNPVRHLTWSVSRKWLPVKACECFHQILNLRSLTVF